MQSIFAWLVCTIEYRNLSPETGHKGDFEISVGRSRDVMLCRFGFALLSKPKSGGQCCGAFAPFFLSGVKGKWVLNQLHSHY